MDGETATGLAGAMAAWAREPRLAAALRHPEGIYLVLDPDDGRVLHASAAARALAEDLGDDPALLHQVAWVGSGDGAPRLARLRLDARRIAPPTLCLVARGARDGGEPAILIVPTGPVRRPRPHRPDATRSAAPPPEPAPQLTVGDRFLWRSDAAGAIVALTGVDGLARLVGRSWEDLAAADRTSGGGPIPAALRERRTFRGEPLRLDFGHGPFTVELSGAPLGRGEAAFAGFGGFGVVRAVPTSDGPVGAGSSEFDGAPPTGQARTHAPEAVLPLGAAEPRSVGAAARPAPTEIGVAPPAGPEAGLSTDEHAAFREIARALGARYAGDEEAPAAPAPPRPEGGSVMRFPGLQAVPVDAPAGAPVPDGPPPRQDGDAGSGPGTGGGADRAPDGETDFLAGLPIPALLHRDETILAASRPLLDLTGHPDLAALAAAGLGRLFRGLPPDGGEPGERRTAIETADGRPLPVEVLRGACTWRGTEAICLILRRLGEEDAAGALAAERVAREVQAARADEAEATLDALAAGVVALDGAGRVVALNRAAADLFGSSPCEVIGGRFAALFDGSDAASSDDPAHAITGDRRTVSAGGRALTLAVSPARDDGRRVAVVEPAPIAAPAAASPGPIAEAAAERRRGAGGGVLARLDRELRAPTSGIVALADAMMHEPFGPLGDARYRGCLAEIKAAGERMLERVTELLDLAAVEAGALDLDPRPLALNDVVAGCVAKLQPDAARGRIVLRTSFSSDLTVLEADERSVSRAACLVIEHAIRRSAAGGQVIVSTAAAEGAGVALRVRDTGACAASAESGPPAAGIADLALPRALVEANGGRLTLSDRAAADGALVEIILPARRAG